MLGGAMALTEEWPLIVLPAGVLLAVVALAWMLPLLSPSGLLFGVTVGPRVAEGPGGQSAIRIYRLVLVTGIWAPVVLWALGLSRSSVGLLMLAPLSLVPELIAAYLVGHARARALAGDASGATTPVPVQPRVEQMRPLEGEATSSSPLAVLLGFLPYLLVLFVAGWLAASYARLPDPFPVHTGPAGRPDRWMPKSPAVVFLAPGIGLAVLLFLGLIRRLIHAARQGHPGPPGDRTVEVTDQLLLGVGLFVGVLIAAVSLGMGGLLPPQLLLPAVAVAPLLFLGFLLAAVVRLLRARHTTPAWSGDGTPDAAWKGGMFYVNPDDPALLVPKRFGIGWTLNFARPGAWLLLVVLLGVPLAIAFGTLLVAR